MDLYFLINSLAGGGAEKVLVELVKHLKPKKVFLLEKDIKYQLSSDVEILSSHTAKTNPIFKTFFIPFYAFKLSRKIKKEAIVLSFLERANFVNIFSKVFIKHKAIVSVHMDQLRGHSGIRKFNQILCKIFYPKADKIVAVSQGVKESLIKLGIPEKKIKVIYNPFPIEEIREQSKECIEEIFQKFSYIITVGRLTKQKGQWLLLKAFSKIKKEFPDLKLLILGEGELRDYLVNLSETLGFKTFTWFKKQELTDKYDVYFLGFQKNPFKYVKRAKLFVLSSLWEGFPNVLIEAMALGVPVISTDCPSGPNEIIKNGENGILVPVGNEKALANAILKLLSDSFLREKCLIEGKKSAEEFKAEKIIKEWEIFLKEI